MMPRSNQPGFFMANATVKVKDVFQAAQCPLTLANIKDAMPELKSSEISMALMYFVKQGHLSREQIDNESGKGRKKVWLYQFHSTRLESTNLLPSAMTIQTKGTSCQSAENQTDGTGAAKARFKRAPKPLQ
jgi:hypothetical protein